VLELAAASAITGLAWDYPWLAASLQNGEVLLLDAEAAVSGGGGRSGGGVLNSASQRSSSVSARAPFNYRAGGGGGGGAGSSQRRRQPGWPCRAVAAGVPGGAQCVALSGRWLAAGFEGGAVATWDFGGAGEARREAEALRAGRRRERERRQAAAAAERKGRGKKKGGGGKTTAAAAAEGDAGEAAERPPLPQSAPLPIPRPGAATNSLLGSSSYQYGRSMGASPVGTSAGGRGAAAARVPAPISLGRSPGAAGEDGQSRWAVLRTSRSASAGSVGQRAQPRQREPEPAAAAIEDDSRDDACSSDSDV
jgi:hypothetical protein